MMDRVPAALRTGKKVDKEKEITVWWEESIKLMSDFHFLERILEFDKDSISLQMIQQVSNFPLTSFSFLKSKNLIMPMCTRAL